MVYKGIVSVIFVISRPGCYRLGLGTRVMLAETLLTSEAHSASNRLPWLRVTSLAWLVDIASQKIVG